MKFKIGDEVVVIAKDHRRKIGEIGIIADTDDSDSNLPYYVKFQTIDKHLGYQSNWFKENELKLWEDDVLNEHE